MRQTLDFDIGVLEFRVASSKNLNEMGIAFWTFKRLGAYNHWRCGLIGRRQKEWFEFISPSSSCCGGAG